MSPEFNLDVCLLEGRSIIKGRTAKACILATCLALLMVMAGCHSGPANATNIPTPAVAIALGTTPSSLTVGQTFQFSATVTNSTNTAVTWSVGGVAGGNSTLGTISSSGLYTAPAMMPNPAGVTITATSQADSTKSVSATVAINISLTLNLTSASVQVSNTQQFTATVLGATDPSVTWTVNGVAGGNSTVGTISSSGLYTAPAYPPSPTTVTLTATSVAESSIAASGTVTVVPPPISVSVNPTALDLQVGHSVQFTDVVSTSSSIPINTSVTWGVSQPGEVGNAVAGTVTSTGNYTAPTRIPVMNPVKVFVVSTEDPTKMAIANVTVTSAPVLLTISTNSLANGVVNTPYSATVSAYGGAQPYAWSVAGGSLPAGLTLNSSSGVISGTPTTAGTTNFTVSVTDQSATPQTQTANLSITIIPQLSIITTSLSNGAVGSSYSSTLSATGGVTPYTWSITSGTLPAGLSLSGSAGTITGTPATGSAGAYPLTLKVTDAGTPQQSQTLSASITIYTGLTITTTSLPNDVVGTAYNQSVGAVGGTTPYTWSYTGTLPPGLSLAASGASYNLTGTPTTAGTYSFTVQVVDSSTPQQTKTQALSVIIYTALTLPTVTLPNGVANTAYSTPLVAASGGTTPYTYDTVPGSGSLPAGLALNHSTGVISGTPTTGGTSTFSVKVTDSSVPPQTSTEALSITIYAPLSITTTSLVNGTVNSSYSATLASTGGYGAITWSISAGSLPANLILNPSTGAITGIPASAATTSFTVTATDSGTPQQTKSQALGLTVNPILTITTTTLPDGTVGATYNQNVQTNGGTLPIKWSVTAGSLPTGLQLQGTSNGAGTITGTPTAAGPYSFTVTATDSSTPAVNVNQALTITINNAPLAINTTSLPAAVINVSYSQALQASGGTPPYNWTVASGSLPAGLSISGSGVNWTISGTPTAGGTVDFTLKVTDSSSPAQSVTQSLSMTVSLAACGTGNESILSGQYAFSMAGYNSAGYLAEVGSFTADGSGHFTTGELDSYGTLVQSAASIDTTKSSYSVGSDNRGCATIATSNGAITTRFVLGSLSSGKAAKGRMIEWENPTSSAYIASGTILKQTTPFSVPSGTYVFLQNGTGGSGERKAGAGVITFGSNGSITAGEMDMNDGGTLTNSTSVTGSLTNPDANGRSTMTTAWQGESGARQAALYLVSSSQALYIPASGGSTFIGEADLQTGTFNNSSLSGKMVIYGNGTSGTSAEDSFVGLVNSDGSSSFTVSMYEVDGAGNSNTPPAWENLQSATHFTCSYSVAANGRMLPSGADPNCTGAPVLYLTAANTAVLLGSGSSVDVGAVEPQANITFDNSTVSGNFFMGPQGVIGQSQETEIDEVALSNGTVNTTSDFTSTTDQVGDNTNQSTITVNSDGTVSTVKHGVTIVSIIVINTNKFVLINNVTDAYPYIMIGER